MNLSQEIGDAVTHRIPLRWKRRPFTPSDEWFLIFTLKSAPNTQADASAAFQKTSDLGIVVSGSTAAVSVLPIDTAGGTYTNEEDEEVVVPALTPGTYYYDIQAQNTASPTTVRTVARDELLLIRDVTRGTETAVPVYVAAPGVTYGTQIVTYL